MASSMYVEIISVSEDSIQARVAGLDIKYDKSDRKCKWYLYRIGATSHGPIRGSMDLPARVSHSDSIRFDSLEAGVSYVVEAIVSVPYYGDVVATANATTTPAEERIAKWSWHASNGEFTDDDGSETEKAYVAITSNRPCKNFSYRVWNEMVDKVKEIIDATGGEWATRDTDGNTYCSYERTRMTATDRVLTAPRFNSLRFNIGSHYSTGLSNFRKGDIVRGEYFTILTDCINDWIDMIY